MAIRIGSWGTPELGLTEKLSSWLGGGKTQQGGSNIIPQVVQKYIAPAVKQQTGINIGSGGTTYRPPATQVLSTSTGGGLTNNGSNNAPANNQQNNTQGYIDNVNQGVNDYGSLIDADYENAMQSLSAQESGLQAQAQTAQTQIGNEFNQTSAQLTNEQATNVQGVEGQLATGEKSAFTGMQGARDLFRQTQQANIAQLSGLGISSSSVAEALAETLGVETMRRINSITGSLSEVRQNASKELSRINNYFQEKKTALSQSKDIELSKIQQGLMSGLNQINTARNQAAIDKAKQRFELISNARTAIDNINQQAQQFEQSLAQWNAQKSASLEKIVSNPEYLSSISNNLGVMNKAWAPPGWEYVPNVNGAGQVTGYTLRKKDGIDVSTPTASTPLDYTSASAWGG